MRTTMAGLALLLAGTVADAQTLTSHTLVEPVLAGDEFNVLAPPDPIGNVPRFSNWLEFWRTAGPVSEPTLTGDWKLLGRASTRACGHMFRDVFDMGGVTNRDGSQEGLLFNRFPAPPPRPGEIFGVKIFNLGKRDANQGPFRVVPTEPQFSQWGYVDGKLSTLAYYEFSCRQGYLDHTPIMVCMVRSRLRNPPNGRRWDDRTLACAAQARGFAQVYALKTPGR